MLYTINHYHQMNKLFQKSRIVLTAMALSAAVLLIQSCRPSSNDFVSDFDMVFTTYDTNFSFETRKTYYLSDTVLIIGSDPADPEISPLNDRIVSSLAQYMYSAGWERVAAADSAEADLYMLPMISTSTFSSCVVPCWGCVGWGWGFPPTMACSSFSTGSLFVLLADPNNPFNFEDEYPVVWTGVINGLLRGSQENIAQRIEFNISQMFDQSPYLKLQQ